MPERGVTISFSSWEMISKQRNVLPEEFLCLPSSLGTKWIVYANHVIHGWGFGPYCTTWSLEGPARDWGQSCRWSAISLWLNSNKILDSRFRWFLWLAINHACYKSLQREAGTVSMSSFHALKAHAWDFPGSPPPLADFSQHPFIVGNHPTSITALKSSVSSRKVTLG